MTPELDRVLLGFGVANACIGAVCVGLLRVRSRPILGVHPAWKPLKFALSIALFLITLSVLLPVTSMSAELRRVCVIAIAASMTLEMTIIGAQALRGRRSHFNVERPLDAALKNAMFLGILVLLLAMLAITWVAMIRPLAQPALLSAAWRAALCIFLFAAASGFGMGGRGRHTIGGDDGGDGMPVTNWSKTRGDLRVSHFFSLHALQLLPALAMLLSWAPISPTARWTLLVLGVGANAGVAGWTWIQALRSRPLWRCRSRGPSRTIGRCASSSSGRITKTTSRSAI